MNKVKIPIAKYKYSIILHDAIPLNRSKLKQL